MKAFFVFVSLCAVAVAQVEDHLSNSCYNDIDTICKHSKLSPKDSYCSAKYGGISKIEEGLQKFVNDHFTLSFHYLLMATHFDNYNKNRPGFEKLFRGLSDDTWEDGIELIKYITKRGGEMNFNLISYFNETKPDAELYEYYAVGKALDNHKKLALEAFEVQKEAANKAKDHHDPEITSYLEHEFMHKHRDIVRKLAGYTSDLNKILDGPDSSLSLYLFDEYLQKQ